MPVTGKFCEGVIQGCKCTQKITSLIFQCRVKRINIVTIGINCSRRVATIVLQLTQQTLETKVGASMDILKLIGVIHPRSLHVGQTDVATPPNVGQRRCVHHNSTTASNSTSSHYLCNFQPTQSNCKCVTFA